MNFLTAPLRYLQSLLVGFGVAGVIAFWGFLILIFIGYFINIYKLVTTLIANDFSGPGVLILRVIGVFIGYLGGIMGIFV